MDIITFLILAMATHRLSYMISYDDGPFDVFNWFRLKAGIIVDNYGNTVPLNNFAKGVMCMLCNSVWVGFLMLLLYYFNLEILVLPFALSDFVLLARSLDNA